MIFTPFCRTDYINRVNNGIRPRVETLCTPLALTKAKTARDAFLQGFLITIYLMIIDKGILTLLVINTFNLIEIDFQY